MDAPWGAGNEFDLKKHIKNRITVDSILKQKFDVDYPLNPAWSEGNIQAQKYFSAYANMIKTEDYVSLTKNVIILNYKDDDHLRSSHVASEVLWIERIYNLSN